MAMSHRHSVGVIRREFIQVGFSGLLGLGLPGVLAALLAPRVKEMRHHRGPSQLSWCS